jgi:hypothetical protein
MGRLSYLLIVALVASVTIGLVVPLQHSAEAGDRQGEESAFKYIGAAGCKHCHQGKAGALIYETWGTTEHAKAFEHLDEANRKNEECLMCHTTGYGQSIAAGATVDKLHGVQCEACHGPGSEYKKFSIMKDPEVARQKGLTEPSKQVCLRCHVTDLPSPCRADAEAAPKFDFESAHKKVAHYIPEKSHK